MVMQPESDPRRVSLIIIMRIIIVIMIIIIIIILPEIYPRRGCAGSRTRRRRRRSWPAIARESAPLRGALRGKTRRRAGKASGGGKPGGKILARRQSAAMRGKGSVGDRGYGRYKHFIVMSTSSCIVRGSRLRAAILWWW